MTQEQITILNELVAQRDRLTPYLTAEVSFLNVKPSLQEDLVDLVVTRKEETENAIKADIQARVNFINGKIDSIGVNNFPADSTVHPDS